MKKLLLVMFIFLAVRLYPAAVLPTDYAADDALPFNELNQIKNYMTGDWLPVSPNTFENEGSAYDIGSATYPWRNAFFIGDVGIGTASPLPAPWGSIQGLHIDGTVGGLLVQGNNSAYMWLYDENGTAHQNKFQISISSEKTTLKAVNDSLADTYSFLTMDHSNGKVGIGVSDPDTKLEVLDTSDQIKFSYDGSNYGTIGADSGGDITITPSGGDITNGTFNLNAGVITGCTAITSTAFTGTLQTAAQTNITSLGTLTSLDVDNINVNTNTITTTSGGLNLLATSGQSITIGSGTNPINLSGQINTNPNFDIGFFIGGVADSRLFDDASNGGSSTTMYIGNQSITTSSDKRYKKNIVDSNIKALDLINKIRIVDFEWDDPTDQGYNNRNARGKWTGFIAQEAIDILPTMINAPRDKKTLEIDYESEQRWMVDDSASIPVLMKAIQELSEKIKELEKGK